MPVLLEALPYRKDDVTAGYRQEYQRLAGEHGYAVARVDLRGTGSSEGVATDEYPPQEQAGLCRLIEWLAAQPWSTGGCSSSATRQPGFKAAAEGEATKEGITFRLRDLERPGPGLLSATTEYQVGDRLWTQTFTARRLDDDALAATLSDAGLAVGAYLTGDGSWVRATPAPPGGSPR